MVEQPDPAKANELNSAANDFGRKRKLIAWIVARSSDGTRKIGVQMACPGGGVSIRVAERGFYPATLIGECAMIE